MLLYTRLLTTAVFSIFLSFRRRHLGLVPESVSRSFLSAFWDNESVLCKPCDSLILLFASRSRSQLCSVPVLLSPYLRPALARSVCRLHVGCGCAMLPFAVMFLVYASRAVGCRLNEFFCSRPLFFHSTPLTRGRMLGFLRSPARLS